MESEISSSKFGKSNTLSISEEGVCVSAARGKIVESLSKLVKSSVFLSRGRLSDVIESEVISSILSKLKSFANSSGFSVSRERVVSLFKSRAFFSVGLDKSKSILWLSVFSLSTSFEIKGVLSNPSKLKSTLLSIFSSGFTFLGGGSCFSKLTLESLSSKLSVSLKPGISILKSSLKFSDDLSRLVSEASSAPSNKVESGIILCPISITFCQKIVSEFLPLSANSWVYFSKPSLSSLATRISNNLSLHSSLLG